MDKYSKKRIITELVEVCAGAAVNFAVEMGENYEYDGAGKASDLDHANYTGIFITDQLANQNPGFLRSVKKRAAEMLGLTLEEWERAQ